MSEHSCVGSNSHSVPVLKEKVAESISPESFVAEKDSPSQTGSHDIETALKT